ncbi:MAG: hypothetical protein CM1200mP2_48990 [Planctomycetaceae bacterium]|nr:MAG: hypothetical protein CM1200mP2_48990 [Planctomycetaceae bacterium]
MATLNLHYASGLHAQVRVSWLSPVKVRRTMLGGSRRMIVYDDVEPSEKVKVYDKGVVLDLDGEDVTPQKPIYRAGDVSIPTLDRAEALQVETAISWSASGTEVDHSAAVPRAWRSSNCSKPPIARWPRTATSSRCEPGRTTIMPVPFVDLSSQLQALDQPLRAAIDRVLDSCAFAGGPEVEAFEIALPSSAKLGFASEWGREPGHSNCCCGRPTSDPVTRSSCRSTRLWPDAEAVLFAGATRCSSISTKTRR